MLRLVASLLVALALCALSVSAHTTIPTDFRAIVADAGLIVRGHVTDVRGVVVPGRGIESIVSIGVDGRVKGPNADFVSMRIPGGVVGRSRSIMVGAPRLRSGQQAIFFLKRDRANLWRPVGLTMGIYAIQAAPSTGEGVVDPPMVLGRTADAGPVIRGDSRRQPMPVREFESLIRLVMAAPATARGPQ